MTPASQLLDALAALRRQWRLRVILESAVWIVLAALLAVLAGALVTALFGTTTSSLLVMRALGYSLIVVAIGHWLVMPLVRRTSDERFALYVEERAPELRQALLSAVHELRAPDAERASPSLTARLVERTLAVLRPLQSGAALERPRMMRAFRSLGLVAVAGALLLTVGPGAMRHAARLLFAPWSVAEAATPVLAVRVVPGSTSLPRGAAIDVHAVLVGFATDGADLVFRSDSGADWVHLPMSRDSVAGAFTSRLFDLTKPTDYYVDANGIRSPTYRLTVTDLPALRKLAIDLRFPAYTRLPSEHTDDGGDIAAVVGTTVTVHTDITKPVRSGVLAFDNGATVPIQTAKNGSLYATFNVKTTGFYRIDLVAPDGATVPGSVQYAVEAIPDRAPVVAIEKPGRDTKVVNVEEVTVAVRASDDYGVKSLELRYRVNGGPEKRVALTDSTGTNSREPRAAHTLFLEELSLVPGDLIAYHAVARDGAGNIGVSDVYFLEVRRYGKDYHQAEQQGGGGGGRGGSDSPDGFVSRQREVVAGTFNWLRDSTKTTARKQREDVTTLDIAEGRLQQDVAALADRIKKRGAASTDSTFGLIQPELEAAVTVLQEAEEHLVKARGTDALTPEQKALQHLQRAEELYRNVDIQIGGRQGGGGSGSGKKAEELADLFELQTDKLKNQYEAVQEESQAAAQQREADATLEKLKQLASRQQQENERVQRMAEELNQKLGKESGGGGGGGSQRELAKQADEEARRLERLAREQKSPELADAAQRLQQAADAMKRAAAGSRAEGNAALDQLKRAANGMQDARSAGVADGVRKVAQQANALEDREREIAEGVKGLASATGEQRTQQMQQLGARKDALSKDVSKLENDADRLAREGQREQPGAAGKLGETANAIREENIRNMIDFSKSVMGRSADYSTSFENRITENLHDVAEKAGAAAGALTSESASRGQEKSLANARELVRGLESLEQRRAGQSSQQRDGARQFAREFAMRRQNAEALRTDLVKQGIDVADLDKAIEGLRRLENERGLGDPVVADKLQASVLATLKGFEFSLYRTLALGDGKTPTLGTRTPVPAEYRADVEEYYRSLAGSRRKP